MKPSSQIDAEARKWTGPHQPPGRSRPSTRTINPTSTCPADGGKASDSGTDRRSTVRHGAHLVARHGYSGDVDALPVMTAEELIERVRHAAPPTADDVTILWDGRRLDSREAVMEWLAEVEAKRAEESAADANADP